MESASPSLRQLSVSIVVHNSSLERLRCTLLSLQDACPPDYRVSVMLLDNASEALYRADLAALLARQQQGESFTLDYRELAENLGFGAGHNRAIQGLASDYHLVLNPDVELAPDSLRQGLVRMETQRDIVLLSPRVESENGEQEFLCKRYPSVLVLLLRAFAPGFIRKLFQKRLAHYQMEDICAGEAEAEVPLASGCFMLLRTAELAAAGGFDERYFMYFEDFDLSLRLARLGSLRFVPAVRIVHHGGYAASKGSAHIRYFVSSGWRFFRQHGWRFL